MIQGDNQDHQWHDLAPPHPRADAKGYDADDFARRATRPDYSYSYADRGCRRRYGMRLWADPLARQNIFKRIFHGKVAAGVDGPDELAPPFTPVLPAGYPNLFSPGEAWDEDGSTLWEGGQVTLRLTGTGPAGDEIRLAMRGAEFATAAYDSQGRVDTEVRIPETLFPALIEIDGPRTPHGRMRFVFNLGCDGMPVKAKVAQDPTLLVQRGDSLWRMAQQMTGNGRRYPELHAANAKAIRHPDRIYPDQEFASPWEPPLRLSVTASSMAMEN